MSFCSLLLTITCLLSGCGSLTYELPYNTSANISSFNAISGIKSEIADAFSSNICIITDNIMNDEQVDMSEAGAAILVDIDNAQALYSKNAHDRLYPASLTKVMTALVALKYGSADQVLTATNTVNITESGAQLCGLKSGDTMTLNQALHILLVNSANDVAMLIAENVGGTVEHFMELMNQEALLLGATNTNFVNPHGLSDINHYTTAYDLYLIFNEATKHQLFREIIQMTSYETTYYDQTGAGKDISVKTTNLFFRDQYKAPDNLTIVGGKTGTTNAAGHCLILLSKDAQGSYYISVILSSAKKEYLYPEMIDLLNEITK